MPERSHVRSDCSALSESEIRMLWQQAQRYTEEMDRIAETAERLREMYLSFRDGPSDG